MSGGSLAEAPAQQGHPPRLLHKGVVHAEIVLTPEKLQVHGTKTVKCGK